MILPDLNILLYAYNPHMPQHATAHQWWEKMVNGDELVNDNHSSPPLTIRMGQMRWEVLRGLGRFRGRGNEGRAKPDRSGPGP